jgi:hypothetical protein
MLRGLAAVGSWLVAFGSWPLALGSGHGFQKIGYQGRGDFRGRGNLRLIVETLLRRCVAPAQEWCFNLLPAEVCGLFVSSSSWLSFFSSAAGSWAAPSGRSLARKPLPYCLLQRAAKRAVKSAAGIVRICGIVCTGTGTSGGGPCLGENRRRGCAFGLTGRRWRCGLRAQLRLQIQHLLLCRRPHTHSSQRTR